MPEIELVFNGVDGATGGYLLPKMSPHVVAQVAQGEKPDPGFLLELSNRYKSSQQAKYGLPSDLSPLDLKQAGWGVIFAFEDQARVPALKEALAELLEYRKEQAGDVYREFSGPDAYRPGESKNDFLSRHGVGPGPAQPAKVPYYLLIVGGPAAIPFRFQYQLDVQYAVGRIYFDDLEAYARYARSVVSAEKEDVKLPRKGVFFPVQNGDDMATFLSSTQLIEPLAQAMVESTPEWAFETTPPAETTKERLTTVLGGAETPALLFTASHGMGFPNGDSRQLPHQGALLCQNWPGPYAWQQPIPHDFYFAGEDVGEDASVLGMITFHFACYGAGTPQKDEFAIAAQLPQTDIAPRPFLASLPQRLLGHPRGGALAVIGHVERAWGYSFQWESAGPQIGVFKDALRRLVQRQPVGLAMDQFNLRYAELSTMLTAELEQIKYGQPPDDVELAGLWTSNNDARSYVILGDPAVRLPAPAEDDEDVARPAIEVNFKPVATAPATAEAAAPVESAEAAMVDYSLRETVTETRQRLEGAVQRFADQLGAVLAKAVDDASSLEVKTYVSDDMAKVTPDFDVTASLRAFTRINFDGDTTVCVPEREGEVYEDLWKIHVDMVSQAQVNRTEMIKAAVSAAAGLLEALKPG